MRGGEVIKNYLLLVGVVVAALTHMTHVNESSQLYLFFAMIALTGIPHGSLDYFIEKQTCINQDQKISFRIFLMKYILAMVLYGILWLISATTSLIFFILLTAYHFGEIDWPLRKNTKSEPWLYSAYGLQMIVFILTSHIHSAAPILEFIVQQKTSTLWWVKWGEIIFPYCCISIVLSFILLLIYHRRLGWDRKIMIRFFAQSFLLIFLIYLMPLYLSFGFYFSFWHSLISFDLIRQQMQLKNDWNGWTCMIRKAIPFTIIAWIVILFLVLLPHHTLTQWPILSSLFIGISILTLPHLQVFTRIKLGN